MSLATCDDLVVQRPEGLYCPPADLYIDPWRPVARAVITHAHADHARPGHGHYLAATPGLGLLRARLGEVSLQGLAYGQALSHRGVRVSLHPAGHVLGSAQVRLEHRGQVWVVSGDYKTGPDPTCTAFEPVRCHTFITECTFGLPIYRWAPQAQTLAQVRAWWQAQAAQGRTAVLYAYALGKAQRLLAGLGQAGEGPGPVLSHGAMLPLHQVYRQAGILLPASAPVLAQGGTLPPGTLVLAPPAAAGSRWLRRLGPVAEAFASGWMRVRGQRARRGLDQGFVLSDHADWPGLLGAIEATGAGRVIVTHGDSHALVRWLQEVRGLRAEVFRTEYGQEEQEDGLPEPLAPSVPPPVMPPLPVASPDGDRP
ncbi:ligase-associated DNA damage response exonuclease [Ideonella livida]|uniref:Ligase-associated DNA damage response exonuclease n=1 Tax=Ideonella livida TaxID=2707176 RepID=A0A7C9PI35_9BURK|nr:ligase-associated DNA damage response exonuclease [Ideonella livida]NDY92575.1 ligase-associated DNA damage response exonuclease [Ideonella livida]